MIPLPMRPIAHAQAHRVVLSYESLRDTNLQAKPLQALKTNPNSTSGIPQTDHADNGELTMQIIPQTDHADNVSPDSSRLGALAHTALGPRR
jgi:hypothetical protein